MSDFGVFEAAASDEGEVARSTREASRKLEAAIYDVRASFPFLMAATGLDDFGDRWHLALNEIRRTVEAAGVFPASGPMGKVQRTLRREVKARLEYPPQHFTRKNFPTGEPVVVPKKKDRSAAKDTSWLQYVTKDELGDLIGYPGEDDEEQRRNEQELFGDHSAASRRTAARPLHEIARDIKNTWPKVNYAAQPYLDALSELNDISDMYYADPAKHIVNYFLSNATTWRGEDAKRIKTELKDMVSGRSAARTAGVDDGEPLIPEGDFKGYLDEVAPQAEPSAERNMSPTPFPGAQRHEMDPAEHNFTARKAALSRFAAWCQRTGHNANDANALELYAFACSQGDYPIIATALRRLAEESEKEEPAEDESEESESEESESPETEGGEAPEGGEVPPSGGGEEEQLQQLVEAFLAFCQETGMQPGPEAIQAFLQQSGLPPEVGQVLEQVVAQMMGGGQAPPQEAAPAPGGGGAPMPPGPQGPPPGPPQPMARRRAAAPPGLSNSFPELSDEQWEALRAQHEERLKPGGYYTDVRPGERFAEKQGPLGKAPAPARGRTAQGEMPLTQPAPLENQAAENNLLDTALQSVQEMQAREQAEYEQIAQALEQATQALQFAVSLEQAEHPMDVTPPDGTVQVRPESPEQMMQQQQAMPAPEQQMAPPPEQQMMMPQAGRVAAPNTVKLPQPGKVIPRADAGEDTPALIGTQPKKKKKKPAVQPMMEAGFKTDIEPVINSGGPRTPQVDDYLRWATDNQLDPTDENNYTNWGKKQRAPQQQAMARNSRRAHGGKYVDSSTRKEAWTGWGPAQPGGHKVAGWKWDGYLNGYVASAPHRFACSCGQQIDVPSYHNCRCGKIWNSYPVGSTGDSDHREASVDKWLCREIVGGVGIIMANKQAAADDDTDEPITDYDGERGEKENRRVPSTKVSQPPKDWARRDKDGTWTGPAVGPKRR